MYRCYQQKFQKPKIFMLNITNKQKIHKLSNLLFYNLRFF